MQAAAQRCLEFMCARFSDPVYFGDYPQVLRDTVPNLPKFTSEQQAALKGSVDYFLINHYSTKYISHKTDTAEETGMNLFDGTNSVQHTERNGKQIGPQVKAASLPCTIMQHWHGSIACRMWTNPTIAIKLQALADSPPT